MLYNVGSELKLYYCFSTINYSKENIECIKTVFFKPVCLFHERYNALTPATLPCIDIRNLFFYKALLQAIMLKKKKNEKLIIKEAYN